MELGAEGIPFVFHEWSWQCQLVAIGSLLNRNEEADKELAEEIKRVDEVARWARGRANDNTVEHYVELVESSFYQDAAHSMAAVGMIAPFIESLFRSTFVSVGASLAGQGGIVSDVVRGVKEAGMGEYMPADLEPTLRALFEYRNKMFHGGFEWSSEELGKFQRRLCQKVWPSDWFAGGYIWRSAMDVLYDTRFRGPLFHCGCESSRGTRPLFLGQARLVRLVMELWTCDE